MERLDKTLLNRNLVETRTKAQALISNECVLVDGKVQTKPSFLVSDQSVINIKQNDLLKYVSRGGLKLEKALEVFKINVKDKVIMDIGSSTGGFTDCSLQNGAKKVFAVDVGTNVMHQKLRQDPRVELHENTNVQDVENSIFQQVDMIVVDVSFVSLERIIEKVASENVAVDMICLIKPQFECGKEIATRYGGVIKSKTVHKSVINKIIEAFNEKNFYIQGLDVSPIKGGDGNIEYISLFTNKCGENSGYFVDKVVNTAFERI